MKENHQRCTMCVLSEAFPKIDFDEHGVCSFCRDELFYTVNDRTLALAKDKIDSLFSQKRGNSEYDAVMCYSGGKDSTYTLMLAIKKYGLRVLAFTLDNGFISPGAFENIKCVTGSLGTDSLIYRPSTNFLKRLIKASAFHDIYNPKTLVRISAVCNSCISLVNITALKIAIEKKIPFILAGFTLGQIPSNAVVYQNNYRFLQDSRQAGLDNLKKHAGNDIEDYFCIREALLDTVESYPHNINLLCLEDISEKELVSRVASLGWVRPQGVDGCSSNCMLNTFNNYMHEKKFGYNPYELELSHLIRKGQITRTEALEKIQDQPKDQIVDIMEQLGIHKDGMNKYFAEKR